jgi:hypothetical protein
MSRLWQRHHKKLGAHDRGAHAVRKHEQLIETGGEVFGRDVVRVSSERGMPPASVDRIRIWGTSSAELGDPTV